MLKQKKCISKSIDEICMYLQRYILSFITGKFKHNIRKFVYR